MGQAEAGSPHTVTCTVLCVHIVLEADVSVCTCAEFPAVTLPWQVPPRTHLHGIGIQPCTHGKTPPTIFHQGHPHDVLLALHNAMSLIILSSIQTIHLPPRHLPLPPPHLPMHLSCLPRCVQHGPDPGPGQDTACTPACVLPQPVHERPVQRAHPGGATQVGTGGCVRRGGEGAGENCIHACTHSIIRREAVDMVCVVSPCPDLHPVTRLPARLYASQTYMIQITTS